MEDDPQSACRGCLVECCASSASSIASFSHMSLLDHSRSSRSRPRNLRSASSITSLSPLPSRAARTFTHLRTSWLRVTVVLIFDICASWHQGAAKRNSDRRRNFHQGGAVLSGMGRRVQPHIPLYVRETSTDANFAGAPSRFTARSVVLQRRRVTAPR